MGMVIMGIDTAVGLHWLVTLMGMVTVLIEECEIVTGVVACMTCRGSLHV